MAEQLLSCEHPTSRNPSSKKQGNKPARTAGKRPVRQLRYLRLTSFDSLWRLCVSFFLSVARRRLQQFAASFRQPPHAGDWRMCTENLIRIDCVTESPNVNGDDRALLPLPDPVRLAVQVEEPT